MKRILLKCIAFLRIIRWYNLILSAIAQVFISYFIFNTQDLIFIQWLYQKPYILYIIFSNTFALAAGFIINSFYDTERDLINKPNRAILHKLVSNQTQLNVYMACILMSLLSAVLVSKNYFFYYCFINFLFWFFSHKLQKIMLLKEIGAVFLSINGIVAIWLHFGVFHLGFLVYILALFIMLFTREIVKDFKGNKGNILFGYYTVVVEAGENFVKKWLVMANFLVLGIFILGYLIFGQKMGYFTMVSGFALCISILSSLLCLVAKNSNSYSVADVFLKIGVVFHILSLMVINYL